MPPSEPFTFIDATSDTAKQGYDDYVDILSAKAVSIDVQFSSRLRKEHPELTLTAVPASNLNLIRFADLGYASYELDLKHETAIRLRGYIPPGPKGEPSGLVEAVQYAKYNYKFGDEYFLIYWVLPGYTPIQYVLKEPRGHDETPATRSSLTEKLLQAAGDAMYASARQPGIWVFDQYWQKSLSMYDEVHKSTWDKIILDEKMKESLTQVTGKFFDSKKVYEDLGVPWKRGLLFHGPPGNGKTISIKALMRTLAHRKPSIPTLYVRNAPGTGYIANVFSFARRMAPCMLVLEDIETVVNSSTRSYFFNEVDGLENNDGILMLASTNFLERLDPGLSKRPSRFDRKYLFPLPNEHERELYTHFWRHKLESNPKVDFPDHLCPAMARITYDFSFAYIQEAFVATLLEIARRHTDEMEAVDNGEDDNLNHYLLWRIFKEEVKVLRKDMSSQQEPTVPSNDATWKPVSELVEGMGEASLADSTPAMPGSFIERDEGWRIYQSFPVYPSHGTAPDIRKVEPEHFGHDPTLAAWGRYESLHWARC